MVHIFKSAYKIMTGVGAISHLGSEIARLKMNHPLVVTDKMIKKAGLLEEVTVALAGRNYGIFLEVEPEPAFSVVEACKQTFVAGGHDGVIAIGGGSALDTAKATAAYVRYNGALADLIGTDLVPTKGVPLIAIPTTAGTGSEVTNIAILSDNDAKLKKGMVSDHLLPDVAIVSPELSRTTPPAVTAASGIDALVHGIEAYLSVNASPLTDAFALQAIEKIARNLPEAYAKPTNLAAREEMAVASLMAGMAFGNAGVSAVHALAYPLGGRFNMAHGVSNAVLLPYVMRENKVACVDRLAVIAEVLGVKEKGMGASEGADQAISAMERLCDQVHIPSNLREFGIRRADLTAMAEDASKIDRLLKNNPRLLERDTILSIYERAWAGRSV
ncbi:iron-containing alcohol dehydrogenase [Bacillus sp. FSL R5-0394]